MPTFLEDAAASQGTVIESWDIIFVRTGLGEKNTRERRAGLHPSCVVWVQNKQIALLGSNGDNDAHPVEGFNRFASTFYTVGIPYLGLPIIDNAN
ncbi:MAG: cyclase family protein, partial [Fulvivirga sp.]